MIVWWEHCEIFLADLNYSLHFKHMFKKFAIFMLVQIINNTLEYLNFYHKSVELFWGMLCFWIFFDSVTVVQESKLLEQKNHELTQKYNLLLQLYHKERKMDLVLKELKVNRQEQCKMQNDNQTQFQQIHSDLNIIKCILHRKSLQADRHFKFSNTQSPDGASSPSFTFKIEVSTDTEDNLSFCTKEDNVHLGDDVGSKHFKFPCLKRNSSWRNNLSVIPPLSAE